MLNVVIRNVHILSVVMLSVVMLSVVMLSVIMLGVVAPKEDTFEKVCCINRPVVFHSGGKVTKKFTP